MTAKHYPVEQRERAVKKVLDGATVRGFPDLAPVVVRTTAGRPAAIPAELRLPAVSLLTSWSRRCAAGRKSTRPALVTATARIAR